MKTNVVSERVWQTLRESSDLCLQVKHYSCSHRYLNSLRSLGGCHAYQLSQSASQSVWHFTVCWCPLLNKVSQGGFYRSRPQSGCVASDCITCTNVCVPMVPSEYIHTASVFSIHYSSCVVSITWATKSTKISSIFLDQVCRWCKNMLLPTEAPDCFMCFIMQPVLDCMSESFILTKTESFQTSQTWWKQIKQKKTKAIICSCPFYSLGSEDNFNHFIYWIQLPTSSGRVCSGPLASTEC